MTDGYEVYNAIAKTNALVHLGCWEHCRRYFIDAEAALPKSARGPDQPAAQFIAAIAELYTVEAHARTMTPHVARVDEVHQGRDRQSSLSGDRQVRRYAVAPVVELQAQGQAKQRRDILRPPALQSFLRGPATVGQLSRHRPFTTASSIGR